MGLATYYQKSLFHQSTEWQLFVVHKHDATRLHYDFRLEHAGVLKSWVLPRGPCLDPGEKRLAVHVDDHPIGCCVFEGTIPACQYGAGPVMLWDRGGWRADQDMDQALHTGRLKFQLWGGKLKGDWSLIRMSSSLAKKREEWLLVKERDTEAKSLSDMDILVKEPASALTGRTLEQIASDPPLFIPVKSTRSSKSKKPAPNQLPLFPDDDEPLLATPSKSGQ
jgi:bifunctional non-homologous end joining protein LigD